MDDCDYMSDEILAQCSSNDVRPGLLFTRKLERDHQKHKKKLENFKQNRPLKEIEEERRKEGLDKAIPEDNKGFKLLQKMGYKAGTGLGKKEDGVAKPIGLKVKTTNTGLGHEKHQLEKLEKSKSNITIAEFRSQVLKKRDEKYLKFDYEKSQRVCLTLDKKKNNEADDPEKEWYWPQFKTRKEDDAEEEEKEEPDATEILDRLEELTKFLRTTHFYCIWCGVEYDDEKDLASSCPGPTRELHVL